jgi:hypothetical protein
MLRPTILSTASGFLRFMLGYAWWALSGIIWTCEKTTVRQTGLREKRKEPAGLIVRKSIEAIGASSRRLRSVASNGTH